MKRILCVLTGLLASLFIFAGCGGETKSPVEGKRAAYIVNMPESDIFTNCAAACVATAEKLGMTCDTFFTDGDDEAFQERVRSCAESGCDGLFLSHGGESYSYAFITELLSEYPDLKIVTFDTVFKDEQGNTRKIEGVTQIFQDDEELAAKLLEYIVTEIAPDNTPAKVLKVWVGDYIAAFDRREVGYQSYVSSGKIQTVETIAPSDLTDSSTMYNVMKDTLSNYGDGDIDAIWVAYDEYARECYKALKESGLNIPLVSVDLCSADVAYMSEENSLWRACAYTDFASNGEQGIRILALELSGEYGCITNASGNASDFIEIPASLFTQKDISAADKLFSGGAKDYLVTSDWLVELIGY